MPKILLGMTEKNQNENIKECKNFIEENKYIRLDVKNKNLACIFPSRTGVNKVFLDLIFQEKNRNMIIFDVNENLYIETSEKKFKEGYHIYKINPTKITEEEIRSFSRLEAVQKMIIYLVIEPRDIFRVVKAPIYSSLFKMAQFRNRLIILDEADSFLVGGIPFLSELSLNPNHQIIFRFQAEKNFRLEGYNKDEIEKFVKEGLDIELLKRFYESCNFLEVPKNEIEKYIYTSKEDGNISTYSCIAPTYQEFKEYMIEEYFTL